jgi:phosphoglycerate kinase
MARLQDLELKGKRVLVRVDFNVPLADGKISDDTRIVRSLPTIRYILEQGGKPILMSHLGRPKGKRVPEMSLKPCAERLAQLLEVNVTMADDCVGPEVERLAGEPGVLMLENLRFHPEEEKPTEEFVSALARLGDVYINDAFGTAHRVHASTAAIAGRFRGRCAAGFLMEKELEFLGHALTDPKRPFMAIIGGAKVSSKVGVLKSLVGKVDRLLIGGGMAYTFLKAQGKPIGNSLLEEDLVGTAAEIMEMCREQGVPLDLPVDLQVAQDIGNQSAPKVVESVPEGWAGVDIGPETVALWKKHLKAAGTILWNGPVGIFEVPAYAKGTSAIAHCLADSGAITIVGGGDSVAALAATGTADQIDHISTGGGASLEFIEFGTLPGVEALKE